MYDKIIKKIAELGDTLPPIAGKVRDIGVKKKWLTEKDIEIEQKLTDMVKTFEGEHSTFAEEIHNDFHDAENIWIMDPISHTYNFFMAFLIML